MDAPITAKQHEYKPTPKDGNNATRPPWKTDPVRRAALFWLDEKAVDIMMKKLNKTNRKWVVNYIARQRPFAEITRILYPLLLKTFPELAKHYKSYREPGEPGLQYRTVYNRLYYMYRKVTTRLSEKEKKLLFCGNGSGESPANNTKMNPYWKPTIDFFEINRGPYTNAQLRDIKPEPTTDSKPKKKSKKKKTTGGPSPLI